MQSIKKNIMHIHFCMLGCGMGCFNFAYSFLACFTIFPKLHLVIKENCSILQLNLSIFFPNRSYMSNDKNTFFFHLPTLLIHPSNPISSLFYPLFFSFLHFLWSPSLFPFIFFPKVVITVVVFHLSTLHVFFFSFPNK